VSTGLALVATVVPPAVAQEDWHGAARVLSESGSFRARARAALLLGGSEDEEAAGPLGRALREDPHPAVRTAAATALGELGALAGLEALREAADDPSRTVRIQVRRSLRSLARRQAEQRRHREDAGPTPPSSPPADEGLLAARGPRRWERVDRVVVVGDVDNRTSAALPGVEGRVRGELTRRLVLVPGTAVFPSRSSLGPAAVARIAEHDLPRLRVETHWVSVERTRDQGQLSVRCAVELLLLAEPGETLRGSLRGTVTARAPGSPDDPRHVARLTERALVGALRAALADAADAIPRAFGGN